MSELELVCENTRLLFALETKDKELVTLRAELAAREATDAKMTALGFGGIDAALGRIGELEAELRQARHELTQTAFILQDKGIYGGINNYLNYIIAKWGTKP